MKRFIGLLVLALIFFLAGCANNLSVVNSNQEAAGTNYNQVELNTNQNAAVNQSVQSPVNSPAATNENGDESVQSQVTAQTGGSVGGAGVANPAAKFCLDLGYKTVGADCIFPDGNKCEQWSFYRGKCGASYSFCAKNGYSVVSRQELVENSWTADYAVCIFTDKSECSQADYFIGSCQPGQCKQWKIDGGCIK